MIKNNYEPDENIPISIPYEQYDQELQGLYQEIGNLTDKQFRLEEDNLYLREKIKKIKQYVNSDFNDQIIVGALKKLVNEIDLEEF